MEFEAVEPAADEDEELEEIEFGKVEKGEYLVTVEEAGETKEFVYLEYEQEDVQKKPVLNRKSYTVEEKLKIVEYAQKFNNRIGKKMSEKTSQSFTSKSLPAARHFGINESSVRCFRKQKEMLLKMHPHKKSNRKAFPHWPELEAELKQFVLNYPNEHGTKAKLKDIRKAAIDIASKHGIENFNGSNSYIFKFMLRNQLPSASPRPRKVKVEPKS